MDHHPEIQKLIDFYQSVGKGFTMDPLLVILREGTPSSIYAHRHLAADCLEALQDEVRILRTLDQVQRKRK